MVAENNLSNDLTPAGAGGGGPPRPNHISFRDASSLKLPRMTHHDTVVAAVPRRTYANAHAYHINSISVNSDGETFISSDDLRINLWNLNIQDQSFNIVDIKPANMEELTEVITAAEFHPQSCNWFMYASSKGTIKLADMRESALCDQHAKRMLYFLSGPMTTIILTHHNRIRARRRPISPIILFRNYFFHIRRSLLTRWPLYSFSRLPYRQNMGRQYGTTTCQNYSNS